MKMNRGKKLEPIKVRGGWLYWDITIRMIQEPGGLFACTVKLNRTKRVVTMRGRWPIPLFFRTLVAASNRKGEITR